MGTLLKLSRPFSLSVVITVIAAGGVFAGQTGVTKLGDVTSYTPAGPPAIDYQHAKAKPLPKALTAAPDPSVSGVSVQNTGTPGFVPGHRGTGVESLEVWTPPMTTEGISSQASAIIEPQEFGTSNQPYTTSRVDLFNNIPSKYYPYRAVGKIYFSEPGGTYVCSGSLIDRGLIVTAAHCVADFGTGNFYTGWQFMPGLSGSKKAYGTWYVQQAWVMSSYLDGTDSCYQPGVICKNDVAVLVVAPRGRSFPGTKTGWFGYGWNNYGFSAANAALINQLGYPVSHDGGYMMQRTDSPGFVNSTFSNNTIWGSRQTGGSSGGPELVNLGLPAYLSGTDYGSAAEYNIVVGVTSWGYNDSTVKQQGASPFTYSSTDPTSNNMSLIDAACGAHPEACTR